VQVSGRNIPYAAATPAEIAAWSVYEGAFFGNTWSDKKFACRGDDMTTPLQASSDDVGEDVPTQEFLADLVVGNCADVCEGYTPGYRFSTCRGADDN